MFNLKIEISVDIKALFSLNVKNLTSFIIISISFNLTTENSYNVVVDSFNDSNFFVVLFSRCNIFIRDTKLLKFKSNFSVVIFISFNSAIKFFESEINGVDVAVDSIDDNVNVDKFFVLNVRSLTNLNVFFDEFFQL